MTSALAGLVVSAAVIYISCELFVNGIEWLGKKWNVSQTATGSVLAAFGTALPESTVTLVATAFGTNAAQKQIGMGAALGGPLVLSTIAYAIVGLSLVAFSRRAPGRSGASINVDSRRLSRDQRWFLGLFVCNILLGTVAFGLKPWLGFAFLAAYVMFFRAELRDHRTLDEIALEPLRFRPAEADPSIVWVGLQTGIALAAIFVASRIFVGQIETVSTGLGLAPQLASLLLSPIATELPETLNAVIWVRQGKERLALANISGAMMIQATVPAAFGLFFTPWMFDRSLMISAAITVLAAGCLYVFFRSGRSSGVALAQIGWLYALFVIAIAVSRP